MSMKEEKLKEAAKLNQLKYVFDDTLDNAKINELKTIGIGNFIDGANWAIDKACECHGVLVGNLQLIVKEDAGGYPYIPVIELYDYEKDVPLAKKGDKVKVIIIKEE